MATLKDILFDFINLWAKEQEVYSTQGIVQSVDESKRTCVVTPNDGGADLLDVQLEGDLTIDANNSVIASSPKGFFVVPTVGSVVIVTFTSKENSFISAWTSIDKVISKQCEFIFNDGSNGGLTITPELKTQLDKNNQLLQSVITIINGSPIPEPGNGAPSALQAALAGAIAGKQLGDFSNIENDKVKH
jgi:hypothetical protein